MSRIAKVGVELEGFYKRESLYSRIDWSNLREFIDYSIRTSKNLIRREFIPKQPWENTLEGLEDMKHWIEKNYPDYTNYLCGYHVHISFKDPSDYRKIMSSKFYDYYLSRYEKWAKYKRIPKQHTFWKRWNGEGQGKRGRTQFAARGFDEKIAHSQLTGSNRYYHLNFAYSKHGTLESRLLPMFKDRPDLAFSGVLELINIVDNYLNIYYTEDGESHYSLNEVVELEEREREEEFEVIEV